MDVVVFWVSEHIAHMVQAHTHEFFQLIYCKKQGGHITVGTSRYAARTDHVYLVRPGVLHAIENKEQMYIVEFKFLAEGTSAAALRILPEQFDISDIPLAREMLFSALREGLERELHYNEAVNSAFKLFLIHTIRKFAGGQLSKQQEYEHSAVLDTADHTVANGDVRILNLKYYISNRLHEKITLSELAAEVNFNKTFFVKRFKILFDMPPMKYVNYMRISRAKQLLIQTSLSVSAIAQKTGFSSPHYFSRSFRALEGQSPQQFREKHRKGGT